MVSLRSCQHVVANSQGVASTKLERDISSANAFVARPRKSLRAGPAQIEFSWVQIGKGPVPKFIAKIC